MSTETTNKKIKIDNGTTFGRTYTDKAVDELLKGVEGQKVYTCAITDLLSISDIQNLIGVITSSQSSTAKRYNLLKSIDDIINEYDYIYVDTSALQMAGGLTFRKQINAGTNKNFALCYGYFNFDSSSNKISSFANVVISLSDAWYVSTISSLTLLPNVDGTGANNGKVLTFDTNSLGTNGVPYKWAEVGSGGGSKGGFKFLTTTDLKTYTPDISSTDTNLYSYLILGSDPTNSLMWFPLYKFGDQLAFTLLNIFPSDSSGETITIGGGIYKLSDGQITTEGGDYEIYTADAVYNNFQRKTYYHFITLTSSTSTFYLTYQNTSGDKLITLDSLKTALAGKYLLCNGHTDSKTAEYISGEGANIVVGVVDKSNNSTSGITIDSSFTITDLVSPVE